MRNSCLDIHILRKNWSIDLFGFLLLKSHCQIFAGRRRRMERFLAFRFGCTFLQIIRRTALSSWYYIFLTSTGMQAIRLHDQSLGVAHLFKPIVLAVGIGLSGGFCVRFACFCWGLSQSCWGIGLFGIVQMVLLRGFIFGENLRCLLKCVSELLLGLFALALEYFYQILVFGGGFLGSFR